MKEKVCYTIAPIRTSKNFPTRKIVLFGKSAVETPGRKRAYCAAIVDLPKFTHVCGLKIEQPAPEGEEKADEEIRRSYYSLPLILPVISYIPEPEEIWVVRAKERDIESARNTLVYLNALNQENSEIKEIDSYSAEDAPLYWISDLTKQQTRQFLEGSILKLEENALISYEIYLVNVLSTLFHLRVLDQKAKRENPEEYDLERRILISESRELTPEEIGLKKRNGSLTHYVKYISGVPKT